MKGYKKSVVCREIDKKVANIYKTSKTRPLLSILTILINDLI